MRWEEARGPAGGAGTGTSRDALRASPGSLAWWSRAGDKGGAWALEEAGPWVWGPSLLQSWLQLPQSGTLDCPPDLRRWRGSMEPWWDPTLQRRACERC